MRAGGIGVCTATCSTKTLRRPRFSARQIFRLLCVGQARPVLRNRIYTGGFDWNGKAYDGRHKALVSVDLREQVQDILDGRFAKKAKKGRHDFAFSGLISCKTCGCAVVGEIRNATSTITAPATPVSARATRPAADANISVRKRSKRSSPKFSGG